MSEHARHTPRGGTARRSPECPDELLRPWLALARHTPLGVLTDLDGTLIPFAPTPQEARLPSDVAALLETLTALPGVCLAVVSGRTRASLEETLGAVSQDVSLVAEHGAWLRGKGAWQPLGEPVTESPVPALTDLLAAVVERYPGALLEPKSSALTLHFRRVAFSERIALQVEATSAVAAWLGQHPAYGAVSGAEALEIRPIRISKAAAIAWMRHTVGAGVRLLTLGDDVTDEDMFFALGATDETVLVGDPPTRPTRAHWRLPSPAGAVAFFEWLVAVRREAETPAPVVLPVRVEPLASRVVTGGPSLLVVSNRLPELRSPVTPDESRRRNVGGLVSVLEPILGDQSGLWLGWSGQVVADTELGPVGIDDTARPQIAWLDFPRRWAEHYYAGFCNRALWPLLHSFPGRVHFSDEEWACYVEVNDAFAKVAAQLVPPSAAIWVHDYHLFLLARALRQHGHRGPIGHFLHTPFPAVDLFSMLPWADDVIAALLEFDLLGFQTRAHVENFRQCVGVLSPARVSDDAVEHRSRRTRIGAFPISILPENYRENTPPDAEIAALLDALSPTKLILGVDRLDYTKGISARLQAFGRMLATKADWRGKASLVQISVPSRADVPEYAEQRAEVEAVVGRINGEFGDGRYVPVRYLYRAYDRQQLTQLYRAADVGLVTPLRDGMNLVAKEFVAAQDPARPGVLILSRFAGAAAELVDAVLTNPYHIDALARDLDAALQMPREERRMRHTRLLATITRATARTWAEGYLQTLQACRAAGGPGDASPSSTLLS